ncbi:hypothetical protein BDV25DRAFT_172543 [Aspergillus avenaceus]|uniref:Ubiquitin 3 binding protein But2 C-terminal domain-containing protein n=1 Tax=Aspergillus avenaceus TaxID=36643 RepID=A0A5N6TU38_ASPAV|nr:hypothetical protein BDV25DRAFT_172543 [Aspergillus avenaceus]
MHKPFVLIPLLLSAVTAVPTPSELLPRACTTLAPSAIDILDASTPSSPNTGTQFQLERTSSRQNVKISALTFNNIPAGSTGCRLEIEFPPLTRSNEVAHGANGAQVWSTDPWEASSPPTWSQQPNKREMVGTYNFPTAQTQAPSHTVIASNSCSSTMSWLVELADWQQTEGGVDFQNSVNGIEKTGFMLVFNC